MYLNIQTLQRTSESEIRAAFPNTSFPQPFQPPEGYAVLFATPQPTYDPITQAVRESTPVLTDKGHWEQAWEVVALDADTIAANQAAKVVADLAAAKAQRQTLVDAITVTTASGKVFDGNEDAQRRMTSAITAMDDGDELPWVLHDNTVSVVTRAELREALRLAGSEMAAIWIAPYTQG